MTVKQQPSNPTQTCSVSGGTGTVGSADVSGVAVICATNRYSLGGSVTGLLGSGLVLAAAGEPDLAVPAGATAFVFANSLASGAAYAVTVRQQPVSPSQTCMVANGSGTVGGAAPSGLGVVCVANRYLVGGSVSGLAGSGLILASPGLPDLVVPAGATGFTFGDALPSGTAYSVTVKQQPVSPSQTCAVTGGAGTVTTGNVTGVVVSCVTNRYTVGGTVTNLMASMLILATPACRTWPEPKGTGLRLRRLRCRAGQRTR